MCYSLSIASVSSFFAQLIGIYLVLICLAMLLHADRFKKIMSNVMGHPASLFICSATNIIFSLVVLIPHNIWVAGWPVLITLVGWLTFLKGTISLFFPEKYVKMSNMLLEKSGYKIWTWIWLLIGIYLAWMGLAYNM